MHNNDTTSVPFDASTYANFRVSSLFARIVGMAKRNKIYLRSNMRKFNAQVCPCAGRVGFDAAAAAAVAVSA